jgi:hypothetical protein
MIFYIHGQPKLVVVDEQLPCNNAAWTQKEGELWPALLEKAWAKLRTGYEIPYGIEQLF